MLSRLNAKTGLYGENENVSIHLKQEQRNCSFRIELDDSECVFCSFFKFFGIGSTHSELGAFFSFFGIPLCNMAQQVPTPNKVQDFSDLFWSSCIHIGASRCGRLKQLDFGAWTLCI